MTDRVPYKADVESELARNAVSINRMEGMSYLDYSSYHRMCDFLRISDTDRREPKIAEKVGSIADWAQAISGSKNELDHMKQIKAIIRELGESHVGIDLLDRLNRYVRLDADRRQIEEEMSLYRPDELEEEPGTIEKPIPKPKKTKPKQKVEELKEPEVSSKQPTLQTAEKVASSSVQDLVQSNIEYSKPFVSKKTLNFRDILKGVPHVGS